MFLSANFAENGLWSHLKTIILRNIAFISRHSQYRWWIHFKLFSDFYSIYQDYTYHQLRYKKEKNKIHHIYRWETFINNKSYVFFFFCSIKNQKIYYEKMNRNGKYLNLVNVFVYLTKTQQPNKRGANLKNILLK